MRSVLFDMIKTVKIYGITEPEPLVVAIFQTVNFMDVSSLTTGLAYMRVLQLPMAFDLLLSAKNSMCDIENKVNVLLTLSECYTMVGKFQEAIECSCREV